MANLPGSVYLIVVIMFMFFVLVVAAVAVFVWALSRSGVLGGTAKEAVFQPAPMPDDDAIDIIRRRYARGEITREEYEQLRHDLDP